jgi:hypothetical protein
VGAGDWVGPGKTVGVGDETAGVGVAFAVAWLVTLELGDEHAVRRAVTATAMTAVFMTASHWAVRVITANN